MCARGIMCAFFCRLFDPPSLKLPCGTSFRPYIRWKRYWKDRIVQPLSNPVQIFSLFKWVNVALPLKSEAQYPKWLEGTLSENGKRGDGGYAQRLGHSGFPSFNSSSSSWLSMDKSRFNMISVHRSNARVGVVRRLCHRMIARRCLSV